MATGDAAETFQRRPIDKVRASRDGHAYHETWAARSALELLPPATTLRAIALEGFSVEDSAELGAGAIEIADLVRYHGAPDIARASRVEVVQFKYSIADAQTAIRAADLASTLTKFARADDEFRSRHGDPLVERVIRFDFATNRPIHPNLRAAILAIVAGETTNGDVARQVGQLRTAIGSETDAVSLLKRLDLTGTRGSLAQTDRGVRELLASWSEANDPDAEKRLLKLRNLIRNKVGSEGEGQNLIDRVAVMAELGVDHESQLYPTPDAFPPVAHVVARSVVDDVITASTADPLPLIVHGAGGMGKTVLMQAVADRLALTHRIVMFDGFGAGKWRDPSDGRHRPERTLVHIANLLAGQGLGDILLPVSDITSLMRAFRRRLEQAVGTARQSSEEAGVVLLLDAIDHAAIEALATGTQSFAHLLLKSLSVSPIDGVSVIASCRTGERFALAVGDAAHREMAVPPFSPSEARELIHARDPTASPAEIAALESRSGRNPRCLDTLLTAGRPYDGPRPGGDDTTAQEVLDALLRERVNEARATALSKGATDADIDLLLSGLSILPPPVPISELAAAHGLATAEVESFAADLAPLLERTPYGLMFRDEPTETLIRGMSVADPASRDRVVQELLARQGSSDYAARALPAVLTALQRTDMLVELAFDDRVPPGASKVSQRDIRLARIVAALQACAREARFDDLMRVLLEASLVAAGHERSDRFLYEHPDLAAVAGDNEALRRLFSTKTGWSGGRHSALAIANAFAGNPGEARRNSQRAIDWHNWAVRQGERPSFNPGRASTEWDDIGFAYVEMLAGGETHMANWFARRSDGAMYGKFVDLMDLLERHAASAGAVFLPKDRLLRRVAHCRLSSSGFWAAALRFSTREAHRDRRLITRLAKLDPVDREGPPRITLLSAAARAAQLGMKREAGAILNAAFERPNVYDYSSYWPMDRDAECAVIAAGVASALRGRGPNLLDIAPIEFLALVPKSQQARGEKAFTKALRDRLASPPSYPQKRRRRKGDSVSYENRDSYNRALDHRILPLLPFANFIARLLSDRRSEPPAQILGAALDQLAADVTAASNYPYREGKAYLARVVFSALFEVADAIDAIDGPVAQRMVTWLKAAPGLFIPQLTGFVGRLSRKEACHNAALELAAHVETLIARDTDTASRISAYGELARAVWRVSIADATSYFRRALDLADAIGSDDFDRTNQLLALAGNYAGEPLLPSAAHDLARIFELNQPEASKFPWIEYGAAMAPTAGLASLAMVARLDDRDQAQLGLTLAPLLTTLATSGKMPADLACCIFALEEPIESWTFRLGKFAEAVLATLPANHHDWFFERIVVEIDRSDLLSPWRETMDELFKLAQVRLRSDSPSLARIASLLQLRQRAEPAPPGNGAALADNLGAVDIADPDAIDRAIEADAAANDGNRWPERTMQTLARRATSPAARLAFIRAVALANAPSLSAKIGTLEDHIDAWAANSPGLRDALAEIAIGLASKHAPGLVGQSWESHRSWRRLVGMFGADRRAIAAQVIASLAPTAIEVSGDSWLGLSAQLSPVIGTDAFKLGLERFLGLGGATIPSEVGDGPWSPGLAVEENAVEASAGLIWARLGNHKATSRWRAAHAIRRLAEIDRFDVIERVAARFDSASAGSFGAAQLPFYAMHAQLWLLIAFARVAKSNPHQALAFRALFERVAFNDQLPHIVMRHFAAEALRALLPVLKPKESVALCRRLAWVNASPFPQEEGDGYADGLHATRPDDRPEPAEAFHLDYDFNKYQVSDLTHAFGCGGWEVEDAITRWVRLWDPTIRSMYDCPRLSKDDFNAGSWSSGYLPEGDRYGGYLGWHAVMLVAGEMLATRPISGKSWREDAWADVMRDVILSRPDGLWLADATDLMPLDLAAPLSMPEADTNAARKEDRIALAPLLGIRDGCLPVRLVVSGSWSLPDNVTVTVRSILAEAADADAIMSAVVTDRKFSQWLPYQGNDIDREFGSEDHGARAWVNPGSNEGRTLDRHDPYAAPSARGRASPEDWVAEQFAITPADEIVRVWMADQEPAFWAEAWGAAGGQGESQWEESGDRLSVSPTLLRSLLDRQRKVLILFVKAQRYFRNRGTHKAGDTSSFSHRVLILTVDAKGQIKFNSRVSHRARTAVRSMPARDRVDFRQRFTAIKNATTRGRQTR